MISKDIQLKFVDSGIVSLVYKSICEETWSNNDQLCYFISFFVAFDNEEVYELNPQTAFDFIEVFRRTLTNTSSTDEDSIDISRACIYGLSNISLCTNPLIIKQLFSNSLMEVLIIDLKNLSKLFVQSSILLIGNIAITTDENIINAMIQIGAVEYIRESIISNEHCVIPNALWALGNFIRDPTALIYIMDKHIDLFLLDLIDNNDTIKESCVVSIINSLHALVEVMTNEQFNTFDNIRLSKAINERLFSSNNDEVIQALIQFIFLLLKKDREKYALLTEGKRFTTFYY